MDKCVTLEEHMQGEQMVYRVVTHTHIYPTHTYSVCTMVLNYRHAYCEV